jgi:hypothetical protein
MCFVQNGVLKYQIRKNENLLFTVYVEKKHRKRGIIEFSAFVIGYLRAHHPEEVILFMDNFLNTV